MWNNSLNIGDLFPQNEEVQFLESELQNQKQKFSKLKSFTKSLLIAVKNKDRKKQQVRTLSWVKLLDSNEGNQILISVFVCVLRSC